MENDEVSDVAAVQVAAQEAQAQQELYDIRLARLMLVHRKPQDALRVVERTLVRKPTDVGLLHLRGNCLEQLGNAPGAFACYMSALTVDANHVDCLKAVAALYKSRGMLAEALAAYERAQALQPADEEVVHSMAVVLTDLGTNLKLAGQLQEGIARYQQALQVCPAYAPAYYNMGVVHSEKREFERALELYRQAVALQPSYAQAHCNIGVIHKERGDLHAAIASYEAALAAAPSFQIVRTNLAIALTDLGTKVKLQGRVAEGIALYERALALHPQYADALYNLGVAFGESGQQDKALFMYEMAAHFNPQCAEAYNNLGVIHKERDHLEKATECYMAALHIRPNFPQSLNNLGVVYTAQGKVAEALALLQAAIQACPTYAEAYNNLGVLQRDVGAISEALASYSKCLELSPDSRNAGQNRLLALNYIHPGELPLVCGSHAEWGQRFQRLFTPLPHITSLDRDRSRALRVGYISPDLFTHSVSYFAEAPLSHHRPAHCHHTVYCCVPKADAKTARLRAQVEAAGGTWRHVTHLSEQELAQVVREDRIDILVELTGHTANNRLGVMALQPAPVQATWIGYPNSTGLDAVHYRLTDAVCDPVDTQQTFVEELVRLPGCFLCYTPSIDAPPVSPLPAQLNGFVTFGSFNNLAKITPEVMKLWARILNAVPRSRLVLKNKPFACETAKAHFLGLLTSEGIEPWRVDLLPLAVANCDHLGQYCLMDISLDPFPYAGTTTTCESLYMGVPCITLAGSCHAHNVGVSLLTAMGIEGEWVARDEEQYVALAVQHAGDVGKLAELRAGLRQAMVASQLCQAPAFVEQLEGVYRGLWHRYLDGTQPCVPRPGSSSQQQARTAAAAGGAQPDVSMQQVSNAGAGAGVGAISSSGSSASGGSSSSSDRSPTQGAQEGAAGAGSSSSSKQCSSPSGSAAKEGEQCGAAAEVDVGVVVCKDQNGS